MLILFFQTIEEDSPFDDNAIRSEHLESIDPDKCDMSKVTTNDINSNDNDTIRDLNDADKESCRSDETYNDGSDMDTNDIDIEDCDRLPDISNINDKPADIVDHNTLQVEGITNNTATAEIPTDSETLNATQCDYYQDSDANMDHDKDLENFCDEFGVDLRDDFVDMDMLMNCDFDANILPDEDQPE